MKCYQCSCVKLKEDASIFQLKGVIRSISTEKIKVFQEPSMEMFYVFVEPISESESNQSIRVIILHVPSPSWFTCFTMLPRKPCQDKEHGDWTE